MGNVTSTPLISVVIPAFNEADYIRETIESVHHAAQSYAGGTEIIVVDNNSTDATTRIARKAGAKIVFEPKNQIARARNKGAAAASGELLVFLDADTRVYGDIFVKVARLLTEENAVGGGAWVKSDTGWIGNLFFYLINLTLSLRNLTVGPFLFCQRDVFVYVGGFDESYYAGEEFSLENLLREAGKQQQRPWKIVKYHPGHKIVTSSRKFSHFGGLEMVLMNTHLLWNSHQKLKQKSQCRFWYQPRR